MLLARQTRRSALRGESMFDRAGIIGGGQFARTYFRMAGGQLFRILGKNPSGRRAASSRYSQPFAIRKYFRSTFESFITRSKMLCTLLM